MVKTPKYLMTWNTKQKRWSKKYENRQFWVSPKQLGTPAAKEASYVAANAWWREKQKEIDEQPHLSGWDRMLAPHIRSQYEHLLGQTRDLFELMERGDPWPSDIEHERQERLKRFRTRIAELEEQLAREIPRQLDIAEMTPWFPLSRFASKVKGNDKTTETIEGNVGAFLAQKRKEVSSGRYSNLRRSMSRFQVFVGQDTPVQDITSKVIVDFRANLCLHVKQGSLADYSARDILQDVKQFVGWCYVVADTLPTPPKVLGHKSLNISVEDPEIHQWDIDEVKLILRHCSERTKLYCLLMINCGFYQGDISDLKHREVDWKRGVISRKRSKTKAKQIEWPLWNETFRLLQQNRSTDPHRVLLNNDGKPLVVRTLNEEGKESRTDNIRSAFERVKRKLDIKDRNKTLKVFRKTSSSLLANTKQYGHCARHFLAQSAKSTADKHYIAPPQDLFNEAIAWLGKQYGLG